MDPYFRMYVHHLCDISELLTYSIRLTSCCEMLRSSDHCVIKDVLLALMQSKEQKQVVKMLHLTSVSSNSQRRGKRTAGKGIQGQFTET